MKMEKSNSCTIMKIMEHDLKTELEADVFMAKVEKTFHVKVNYNTLTKRKVDK